MEEIKDRETKREAFDMIQEKETITSNLAVAWDGWENAPVTGKYLREYVKFFFFFSAVSFERRKRMILAIFRLS